MTRLRAVVMFSGALLALAQTGHGNPETTGTTGRLVDRLGSNDLEVAEAAEKELHRELSQLSKDLLKFIAEMPKQEKQLGEPKRTCDRALAVLRTKRDDSGINRFLMMNISYFDNSARSGDGFLAGHPCAIALAQLGPTAAYEIVKYLERPPVVIRDIEIDLFSRVFARVLPTEEALAMLTRAHRRANHKQHIERLQKAVREFWQAPKPEPPKNPEST